VKSLKTGLKMTSDLNIKNKTESNLGFPEDNNNNSVKQKVVSRQVIPIVAKRQSLSGTDAKKENFDKMKTYSSYSDVVLELKKKFSSNDQINSIID